VVVEPLDIRTPEDVEAARAAARMITQPRTMSETTVGFSPVAVT
jgi:hypothetical protein